MSENTKLWDMLGRTDPAHTKSFTRGGGFKGTAIKPMWSYRRMTEEFGPCGKGWGINAPDFTVQDVGEERLVYCTVSIWYETREQVCFGVGGDKVLAKNKYGISSDDEAFKKAFTDAVTNALKMIGVGADVHMGMFDDNKYINTMRQEFADEPAQTEKPKRQVGYRDDGTRTPHSLNKEQVWQEMQRELAECQTITAVNKLAMAWSKKIEADKWPDTWRELVPAEFAHRRAQIDQKFANDDDSFPGDRPSNGNFTHPIMAG